MLAIVVIALVEINITLKESNLSEEEKHLIVEKAIKQQQQIDLDEQIREQPMAENLGRYTELKALGFSEIKDNQNGFTAADIAFVVIHVLHILYVLLIFAFTLSGSAGGISPTPIVAAVLIFIGTLYIYRSGLVSLY